LLVRAAVKKSGKGAQRGADEAAVLAKPRNADIGNALGGLKAATDRMHAAP